MKVSNVNQKVNFTSTPIHYLNAKAPNEEDGYAQMIFSKLSKYCDADQNAMAQVEQTWQDKDDVCYGICRSFDSTVDNGDFFAVENPKELNLGDKITGLINVKTHTKSDGLVTDLKYLITKDKYSKEGDERKIKGIGEILLGEAVNIAKQTNSLKVSIYSVCDGFYEKFFMHSNISVEENKCKSTYYSLFTIKKADFNKVLDYCSRKYKINFLANSLK